jgi:hypothetical protein
MIGYLIDATKREVRRVDYDYAGPTSIARRMGVGDHAICIGFFWRNGDVCYVDDEGMLNPCEHFFRILDRPDSQPLAGNGFVTGSDNDDDTDPPTMSIEQVQAQIAWLTRADFQAWAAERENAPAVTIHDLDGSRVIETWGSIAKHGDV